MKVAVVGGAGLAGRHTVEAFRAAGDEALVLSRRTGVDAATGKGLAAALDGVDAVVDVTQPSTMARAEATAFFRAVARNLQAAGAAAGVRRVVTLSIHGIDGLEGRSTSPPSWRTRRPPARARCRRRSCGRPSSTTSAPS